MLKEELPIRFAMSLAMDTNALEKYAGLSEKKKEKLMKESLKIQNREEMDKFVNKISKGKEK